MEEPFWRWVTSPAVRPAGRPDTTLIVPNLLIGEYPTPDDAEWLRTVHGVTAVLSLQDDADLASKGLDVGALEQAYRMHDVRFHRIPVPDCDTDVLRAQLNVIVALLIRLLRAGECVYLHCNAGLNRAPTAVIAYLHVEQGLPLAAARDLVKRLRQCVPYMKVLEAHYAGGPG
jgi:dual specificity protein phosphatase-like protein